MPCRLFIAAKNSGAKIYKDYPVDYFWGLITLAKVMKVEIGGPHEFDRPSTPV